MKTRIRLLCLAAATAVLFAFAPSAFAISPQAEAFCDDPADAAFDVADYYSGFNTEGATDKDCKKLCSEIKKVCDSNSKNREKCVKDNDKSFFKVDKALCGKDKACKNEVKAAEKACKEELKQLSKEGKDNCKGLEQVCQSDCLLGVLFPEG